MPLFFWTICPMYVGHKTKTHLSISQITASINNLWRNCGIQIKFHPLKKKLKFHPTHRRVKLYWFTQRTKHIEWLILRNWWSSNIFQFYSLSLSLYIYIYFNLLRHHQILSQVIAANNVRTFFPDTYSCVILGWVGTNK